MKNIEKYIVADSVNIRTAVKQMDKGGIGFIAIIDGKKRVIGVVTNGDFRRAVLNGKALDCDILSITNKSFKYLVKGFSQDDALQILMSIQKVEWLPILNKRLLVDIISKDDLLPNNGAKTSKKNKINLPIIIMAGGKGKRLDPFTRILPKALIPFGEKPIIEVIMENFFAYGVKNYFISVNHKHKMIKAFFEDRNSKYNISYIDEDKPLGTAGSIKLIEGQIDTPFFVSNCDIIINCDYSSILTFHQNNNFAITLVASMQHNTIPYGVCDLNDDGTLDILREKPEYDVLVNTGMYLLNSEILSYIPVDTYFDMTDLINIVKKDNHSIGIYPVSEKSWIDVGQWQEYDNAMNRF
jgi:dTDP-glucose pyrophosphorylase